jgi:putative endonuclease
MTTTYEKGLWAERLCVFSLWLRGYRILARRCRTPVGEIDIVARKNMTLAIIEVKYRPALIHEPIVSFHQRHRLERAANYFAKKLKEPLNIRFDLMVVIQGRWPRHFKGAWRPEQSWS